MAELLAGKYEVGERRVVIKRMLPGLAEEAEFVRLFEAEARHAALLEHPNVVQVTDFGRDERGQPWLAMEYVDGASLRQLGRAQQKAGEKADPRLLAHVFARVAEGLASAHELKDPNTRQPLQLVHRDVSPDNVLVSRLGAVKVSDFGIARAMVKEGTTRPDALRGKLRYLSPEQLLGESATSAVDVRALGVCLFEALTGARPFPESNEGETVNAIVKGQRPDVAALRPDCPSSLVRVVDRCLSVDAGGRFPDCHELALALDRVVAEGSSPITTAMVGAWVERLVPARARAEPPARQEDPARAARFSAIGKTPLAIAPPAGAPVAAEPALAGPPPPSARAPAQEPAPAPGRSRWLVGVAVLALALGAAWLVASTRGPAPTRLVVSSTPSGATVRLAGRVVGTTPWAGEHASASPITVRLELPGHAPWDTVVEPVADATVNATLRRR